jgi:hypothetical protein
VLLSRADTTLPGGRLIKSNGLKTSCSLQEMAAFDAFVPGTPLFKRRFACGKMPVMTIYRHDAVIL